MSCRFASVRFETHQRGERPNSPQPLCKYCRHESNGAKDATNRYGYRLLKQLLRCRPERLWEGAVTGPTTHQLVVGDRAHRIVAAALRAETPPNRTAHAMLLAQLGRQVFAKHPVEYRSRESLLDAITAAGVYLFRFRPAPQWSLIAEEFVAEMSRFDLVHRDTRGSTLIDELKLGVGRSAETGVRNQIDRYLTVGSRLWGCDFVGVRLCAVHEPLQSRLYLPDRRRSVLLTEVDLDEGLTIR